MKKFRWSKVAITFLIFFVISLSMDYLIYSQLTFLKSLTFAIVLSVVLEAFEMRFSK